MLIRSLSKDFPVRDSSNYHESRRTDIVKWPCSRLFCLIIDDKRGWTGNALICGFHPRYGTLYIALYIPSSPFGKMATCSKFVSKPDAGAKNAFSRILDDSEFSLPTPRIEQAKECIRYLQTKEDEAGMLDFVDIVWRKLTFIADTSFGKVTKSHSKQRESLWKLSYQFRSTEAIGGAFGQGAGATKVPL